MNKGFKHICMLSTHGYFDPVPQLGRTDTGGQVVYVLELAKALTRLGIKADIYTRWFDKSKKQIDPVPGFPNTRVIRIKAGPWEFIPKEQIYDVLPELANNMVKFIKMNKLNYDLYHGHYVDAGIVTLEVAKAFSKPAFFTAHSLGAWKKEQMGGDPVEMEKKFNFKHRISEEIRIFKAVNAQTVTTRLQEEKLQSLYNFVAPNIVVIPPGVDVHHFRPSEKGEQVVDTGLPDNYIFCLSRIDSNKGHDLLLHAFAQAKNKIPGVTLVIGGGSPKPQQRELEVLNNMKNIMAENGMQDRVIITGYISDEALLPSYQQARLFVLPSIFEPFGMTALEAMACGTPVIASRFGGIKNVISTGKNGILVDPSKSDEFANAMTDLLGNAKLLKKLANEGIKTIQREFSWEAIAQKHINFYSKYMK